MPQPQPAPPAPPIPQIPPPPGGGGNIIVDVPSRPLTRFEVEAIREQRSELSSQLISAAGRRKELAEELRSAQGQVDRAGIEERIRVLDERIIQLETDIAVTGRQITTGQTLGTATTDFAPVPFGLSSDQVTGISIVFMLAVLFPMSIAMARRIWRRAPVNAIGAPEMRELATKLDGLQQAVDTVAIEVERVSEGQRFVTRIMTEGGDKALGGGARPAEPHRVPGRDQFGIRRGE